MREFVSRTNAEKRRFELNKARSEWRDVEDAVDAIESPLLQSFKEDLSAVLNRYYSTLNPESSDDGEE